MSEGIEALRRAKEMLGSEQAVAEVIGRTQPAVHQILTKGKRVPAEWCLPIERATAEVAARDGSEPVTRHQLRPDIYPLDMEQAAQ